MRIRVMAVLSVAAIAAACSDSPRPPTSPESLSVPVHVESAAHAAVPHNHRTHMSGKEEVPVRDTRAQGQTTFQVSPDGQSVGYKLIASNIQNVTQAHIHCGPAGTNGPIIIWLYPSPTASSILLIPGRHDGILAEGTFDNSHVRTLDPGANPACPEGVATLADVLDKIRAGQAYVNVHTTQFPPGEIRGQID